MQTLTDSEVTDLMWPYGQNGEEYGQVEPTEEIPGDVPGKDQR